MSSLLLTVKIEHGFLDGEQKRKQNTRLAGCGIKRKLGVNAS